MRTRLFAALTITGLIPILGLIGSARTIAQDAVQLRAGPVDAPVAQEPAAGPLQFEVASVKPNKSGGGAIQIGIQPGGRLQASNVTLRELIRIAYQVQPFQIVGGPSWVNTDRFDIAAKAEAEFPPAAPVPGGPPGVPQRMVQGLLLDRFKLTVHTETREMPIYDLTLCAPRRPTWRQAEDVHAGLRWKRCRTRARRRGAATSRSLKAAAACLAADAYRPWRSERQRRDDGLPGEQPVADGATSWSRTRLASAATTNSN